jgi:plastocyanin
LALKVGDKINFVYTPPRNGEVRTTFSPGGISSVTVDSDITQRSRTFNTAGTWTFKADDHSGNTGTVVVQ